MKKIILAALLCLVASSAFAQKPPINAVAGPTTSAQFGSIITDEVGSGKVLFAPSADTTINGVPCTTGSSCTVPSALIAGTTPITGTTNNNGLFYNFGNVFTNLTTSNSGVLVTSGGGVPSISSTLPSITIGGTLTLTPPAGMIPALVSNQSFSGSGFAAFAANQLTITNDTADAGAGFLTGWQYVNFVGGSTVKGGRLNTSLFTYFNGATNSANANRNYVAFTPSFVGRTGDGGTDPVSDPKGAFFAIGGQALACGTAIDTLCNTGAATSLFALNYMEADVEARAGSSMSRKMGVAVALTALDREQGSVIDGAFVVGAQTGSTTKGLLNAFLVSSTSHGAAPMASTGTLFATQGSGTVANAIDVSSYTVTTAVLKSTGFLLNGSGTITSGVWNGTPVTNSFLANPSTTVNGQICTLGSTCTIAVGTVTSVSVTTANGVSGTVATATTTPAITLTLGNITPNSVLVASTQSYGWSTRSQLTSPSNGNISLLANNGTTPSAVLSGVHTINLNAASLPAVITGTSIQAGQADTVSNVLLYDSFGASTQVIGRRAQGTNASPTQLTNGNTILNINTRGYDGTAAYTTASNAGISFLANEDWVGASNHGTAITLSVTPNGSGTAAAALTINGTGVTIFTAGSDAGHTDASVCRDTTSGLLLVGSGTLGICLGTSSARYKNNIKPLGDGLEKIAALQPKSFFYNKDRGDHGARIQAGFLAEDVISVMPNLVDIDADARPNSVDILGMIPAMINAIKELKASNDNLDRDVKALKASGSK